MNWKEKTSKKFFQYIYQPFSQQAFNSSSFLALLGRSWLRSSWSLSGGWRFFLWLSCSSGRGSFLFRFHLWFAFCFGFGLGFLRSLLNSCCCFRLSLGLLRSLFSTTKKIVMPQTHHVPSQNHERMKVSKLDNIKPLVTDDSEIQSRTACSGSRPRTKQCLHLPWSNHSANHRSWSYGKKFLSLDAGFVFETKK